MTIAELITAWTMRADAWDAQGEHWQAELLRSLIRELQACQTS